MANKDNPTQTFESPVDPIELSKSKFSKPDRFPYTDDDTNRLADYNYFYQLFEGAHFEAFKQKIKNEHFNKAYAKLKYIYVNFAGMISRIVADMLFGEPVKPKVENPELQAWLEDLWKENFLDILLYESALDNSARGDELFKIRVDKRTQSEDPTVLVETAPASIYFPHIDGFNISKEPDVKELAWVVMVDKDQYLRREIHERGMIYNEVYKMKGSKVEGRAALSVLGIPGLIDQQATNIDRHLLVHIPNWKTRSRHFGYSDYNDLDALFYAINNRITKVDNVLDKHTDPILMVPPGVIDEKGKVKKDARVIEMGEGEDGKPEYIVWDASLENAFKEIEKLVEFIYMIGEVSPDVLGLGKGQSDSGRALKFKLMRTIAKVNRKKLYYDRAIKEALYVSQLLAKQWNAKVGGKNFSWEPEMPELVWQDGLPVDESELIENESKAIDAGITSQKAAVMKVHGIDEDNAEQMIKEIDKEKEVQMPETFSKNNTNPFFKKGKEVKPPVKK